MVEQNNEQNQTPPEAPTRRRGGRRAAVAEEQSNQTAVLAEQRGEPLEVNVDAEDDPSSALHAEAAAEISEAVFGAPDRPRVGAPLPESGVSELESYIDENRRSTMPLRGGVLGKLGVRPANPEGKDAPVRPALPVRSADLGPLVGAGYTPPGGYVYSYNVEIFASNNKIPRVESRTLNRASVAADANGRRIVKKGTILSLLGGTGPKVFPRALTTDDAFGVLNMTVDLIHYDQIVPVIVGDATLRKDRLIDFGGFGTLDAAGQTALEAKGIRFQTYDA